MSIIQHSLKFPLTSRITWHWCLFDAECANHVFFFSKTEDKYGFHALNSPPLCWEAMLDILNCSVKQGSENNYFSHILETCSPFWIPEIVSKPFPLRVLTPSLALQLFLSYQSSKCCPGSEEWWFNNSFFCWWKCSRGFILIFKWRCTGSLGSDSP